MSFCPAAGHLYKYLEEEEGEEEGPPFPLSLPLVYCWVVSLLVL